MIWGPPVPGGRISSSMSHFTMSVTNLSQSTPVASHTGLRSHLFKSALYFAAPSLLCRPWRSSRCPTFGSRAGPSPSWTLSLCDVDLILEFRSLLLIVFVIMRASSSTLGVGFVDLPL